MAGLMYDYLSYKAPDYAYTLSIAPNNEISEDGGRKVQINEADSGTPEVVVLGGSTTFDVDLEWENISKADSDTILDIYHDANKGAWGSRTFRWAHPTDTHVYTVRFIGKVPRVTNMMNYRTITAKIRVEGYYS